MRSNKQSHGQNGALCQRRPPSDARPRAPPSSRASLTPPCRPRGCSAAALPWSFAGTPPTSWVAAGTAKRSGPASWRPSKPWRAISTGATPRRGGLQASPHQRETPCSGIARSGATRWGGDSSCRTAAPPASARMEKRKRAWSRWCGARTASCCWIPYFSASKIVWLLREQPQAAAAAGGGSSCFGSSTVVCSGRLTGRAGCMPPVPQSNAKRHPFAGWTWGGRQWDPEYSVSLRGGRPASCRSCALPRRLPAPFTCVSALRGVADAGPCSAHQTGRHLGQNASQPGEAKCTYGTGAFSGASTPASSIVRSRRGPAEHLRLVPARGLRHLLCLEGSVLQWPAPPSSGCVDGLGCSRGLRRESMRMAAHSSAAAGLMLG